MKFIEKLFGANGSYRRKLTFILSGAIAGLLSMFYSLYIVNQLSQKELNEIKLWSHAMTSMNNVSSKHSGSEGIYNGQFNKLLSEVIENNSVPTVITDNTLRVIKYNNISKKKIETPEDLEKTLSELAQTNKPIEINVFGRGTFYIFYGKSNLLTLLQLFPFLQFGVFACFILVIFISVRSSKEDEQRRVWIGMAKETAHQLGTPTSSLLGWMEYLKSQDTEPFVVEEMNKDITRLLKVVDRFSKIGSQTVLTPKNINQIVGSAVTYFTTRIPKNVELRYAQIDSSPIQAMVNEALFEWVIENLLKNALDALGGKGFIAVEVYQDKKRIFIDVKDSGKGIPKSSFSTIFSPGYTTKTRGWGLGLSLSKRIIDEYHNGNIYVAESEVGKGTTMRIALNRL